MLGLSACATTQRSTPSPSVSIKAGRSVAVQHGETLYSFARRNKASMREIIDLNRLQAPFILTGGTLLRLPATDADLPTVELGPIAKENENQYKQKHRGKPVTTYTQVAPELITEGRAQALAEGREGPIRHTPQSELQAEADNQFNQPNRAPTNANDIKSATAVLNLKPLQFDQANKHLVETTKPTTAIVLSKPVTDKKSKVIKTAKNAKPDPNEIDIVVVPAAKAALAKLPTEAKKAEVKPDLLPEIVQESKKPEREMHSRIEKGAEPKNLVWPVQGTVISIYGPKSNGLKNDGINIAVPRSTPVLAADGGTVAYAGSDIPGYGNVVLVRHPNGLMTTYAHLERMFVQENIVVAKGDLLGTVGTSGGVDTPQLHFEIRRDKEALDPGKYLYR